MRPKIISIDKLTYLHPIFSRDAWEVHEPTQERVHSASYSPLPDPDGSDPRLKKPKTGPEGRECCHCCQFSWLSVAQASTLVAKATKAISIVCS